MDTPVTLTARSPEDLLAAVPYVLGFRPQDSVVLLTFGPPGAAFHARVDLPRTPDDVDEVSAMLRRAACRNQVRRVALIGYSADASAVQSSLNRLAEDFVGEGLDVVDVLRVEDDRWFPVRPGRPELSEGVPHDVTSHPFAARSVLAGRVTLSSREELARTLDCVDEAAREAVADAVFKAAGRLRDGQRPAEAEWVRVTVAGHSARREPLPTAELGRLLVAISDNDLRDVAWATMSRANASSQVDFWRDAVRRAPVPLLAAPAALLAFAAWLSGQGALAWCAVDRCREAEPGYTMATLVAQALAGALPPSEWQAVPDDLLPALRGPDARGPGDPAA